MTTPALQVDGLTVTYPNGHRGAIDVRFDVHEGESVALVGESGCGKTTTLRGIQGLLPARTQIAGSIRVAGIDLLELPPRERHLLTARKLGYVSQDPYGAYDPLRTVGHHVREPLLIQGKRPDPAELARQLADVGIPAPATRITQHPHQWSGGMLQRATIVAGTQLSPLVTLADEPTSALDADLADNVLTTLHDRSRALLFVTHDLALAAQHADRVLVMHEGRIIEHGTSAVVLRQPRHEQTRLLLAAGIRAPRAAREPVRTPIVATASQITKTYRTGKGHQTAVRPSDLTIHAGEIVGVVGPSGSGKSTLLRLVSGMEAPDAGALTWNGQASPRPAPGTVMPISQDPVTSLDPRWPLWRSITEPLTVTARLTKAARIQRAQDALEQVGIGHLDPTARPRQLSVGQAQRVAIARALIARPAMIVADEPTASLDVRTAQAMMSLLRELADRHGVAQFIVSHDVALLGTVADRLLRMDDGQLRADEGAPSRARPDAADQVSAHPDVEGPTRTDPRPHAEAGSDLGQPGAEWRPEAGWSSDSEWRPEPDTEAPDPDTTPQPRSPGQEPT